MKYKLKDNYVSEYAIVGELEDGIEYDKEIDLDHFNDHYKAYKLENDTLVFDEERDKEEQEKSVIAENCFNAHLLLNQTDYKMAQGFERVLDCKSIEQLLETLKTFSSTYKEVIDERKAARSYIQEHEEG